MRLSKIMSAAMIACALASAGCANTVRGVGKDAANTVDATKAAGKNIANAVE